MTDEEIKEFDLVIWHKGFCDIKDIQRAKSLSVPTVVDFDDHWVLNDKHTLKRTWEAQNTSVKLHKILLTTDFVTCTTERLADAIYSHNSNVKVLPNAVPPDDVREDRISDSKYCFGYLGGHFHLRDVGLLEGLQKELTENCKGYELRLFGFDGSVIYQRYAEILSNYKKSANYQIFKGLPIWNYYQFYNLMDCSLVPLENNNFNIYKSELKLIEAGFFKKPVIVSNVEPYSNLITKKNCLAVNQRSDWYKHCKTLIDNPEKGKEIAEELYQSVQKYSLVNVNKTRLNFYSDVHKKFNNNSPVRVGRLEPVNG
jgi:glycosyltransferase involved in cell wall biosynthesis